MIEYIPFLVMAAALLALSFAAYKYFSVKRLPEGTEEMAAISAKIRRGAMAYLKRQYKTVAIFFVVIIILLIASVMKNLTRHRIFRGFLQGVQPVIIALILSTGLILLLKAVGYANMAFQPDWVSMMIFALLLGCSALYKRITRKKIPAIRLILLSAVLGIAVCAGTQGLL
jgi:fumarate reductase subunit C